MQPQASATFAMSASQASTDEPDHPLFSNSFQTIGKLLRVKSGSARSNLKRPSESMPSPTDTSRPGFFHFLSAPPSPRHLANSFKSSRRKNMAPTDAFAQSSVPNTTFRSRTLSHSVSTPNFCASSPVPPPQSLSESTNINRRRSRLSVISQEESPNRLSSGWESDSDDAPLVYSTTAARKNSSSSWKQKAIHKCKSMTWSITHHPACSPPSVTQSSTGTTETPHGSISVQPLHRIIRSVDTPTTSPPFSSDSQSSAADDFPPLTPVSFNGSMLSFQTAKKVTIRSRGSLAKLARTLGVLPAELDYPNEFPANPGFIPNSFSKGTHVPPRPAGRLSLSLSSFASLPSYFRSSSHNRHKSAPPPPRLSHPPPPTRSTEDLQNFTFSNNLLNPHLSTMLGSDSPISPIVFEHSTAGDAPVMGPVDPPSVVMKHNEGLPMDQSRGIVSSLTSLTGIKSKTRLHGPRPMETKAPRYAPFDNLPERSNWLRVASPVPPEDPELGGHRHSSNSMREREPARTNSGQWNQDDMQYVIQRLRTLK